MHRGRRGGGEEGLTLVELLVTVAIMGIAFVVLVGGLGTAIIGSDVHRKQADVETVLRSFAEAVKNATYIDCASPDQYEQGFSAPPGYSAAVTAVAFASPPYNEFVGSCSLAGDGGLQRVTLQVRSDGGRADQSVDVVIRKR